MLFGGASYMVLGDSDFIDVDSVAGANFGVSQQLGVGNLGLSTTIAKRRRTTPTTAAN